MVIGALTHDSKGDEDICREWLKEAHKKGLSATFHRAIDCAWDIMDALEKVNTMGYDRVLTSGGHPTAYEGIEVIKYVSGCIKQRVKGSGFAGRFGGDEFVLCITDPDQIKEIESLSLDLIDELYEGYHSELANVSINVKASIGIAFYPEHGEDSAKVVAAADEAMYFVKKNGKANYHIYQPEDSQMEDLQHTL